MRNVSACFAFIFAATGSGCAIREQNLKMFDEQRPATSQEKTTISENVRNTFNDPYSIRDAEIGNVIASAGLDGRTYPNICVKMNARNSYGAYTGRQVTLFHFDPDIRLLNYDQSTFANIMCNDARVRYTPFKEVEALAVR